MNLCEHGQEIFTNETGDKTYTECRECFKEYERHRALERLMDQYPERYVYCSNEECNQIFSRFYGACRKCGSLPEVEELRM